MVLNCDNGSDTLVKCGLAVRHQSKDDFTALLRYIIETLPVSEVHCSNRKPQPPGSLSLASVPRIDIPLSGRKHMRFASGGEEKDIIMLPGEFHYAPPLCWKRPVWDMLHEMSSIVYNPNYIHITYIDYDRLSSFYENHAATVFYDTAKPIDTAGNAVLQALNIQSERNSGAGIRELMKALLEITLENLLNDDPHPDSKAHSTWIQLEQYLRENFNTPINRAHTAKIFGLNPSYVSRLFQSEGKEGFNSMLRRLRLEHAALLLKNTNMSIDEITVQCGYQSSTFFIAAFKRSYNMTPGIYRRN